MVWKDKQRHVNKDSNRRCDQFSQNHIVGCGALHKFHYSQLQIVWHTSRQLEGSGMDEVTRKRIFEPFFTTKPVGIGTGLGLSVSYFIITENHGGEMRVKPTPGNGTTFVIALPITRSETWE